MKGIITNITDFGLFVEVEEGIEGLVHVSELSNKKVKTPAELYKEGEEIQAKIIHVSAEESPPRPLHQAAQGRGRTQEAPRIQRVPAPKLARASATSSSRSLKSPKTRPLAA